jgi:putative DNA primase/helicase
VRSAAGAWDPEVIDQAIPELPEPLREAPEGYVDAPPVELTLEALKVWRGEKPVLTDVGRPDRSKSLLYIGRVLYDAGATRRLLVEALRERDETLGWRKYAERADAEQRYHEIVDELERNGRNPRVRLAFGSDGTQSYNLTDLGNSERFVSQHGENVRYCYPWARFLVWTGAQWERDEAGKVYRLAKETVRGIYQEAAQSENETRRKALAQHATRSEAEAKIKAMLELAKSEIPVSPEELDADPWLLNAPNGTVDLRTGELREHRREDLITKIAPVEYRPDAPAAAWGAFLEQVLPSEDLRAFVQRAAGYSATGDTSEQCLFINHGVGANGKSTYQEAIAAALGDYAMRASTEMLLAKRSGGVPNDVARLKGSRFVAASETEEGRRLAESLVKDLTGGDTITARFMRAEFFDFKPTHKLWLSTNHKPEIRGTDTAIWRRIRLIPWSVTIPPAEQDKKLPAVLRHELPGILAWIVRGSLEWRREGLRPPEEVRRATGAYRAEMDVLAGFLSDCCEVGRDQRAYASDLYKAYKLWCDDTGEQRETQTKFGRRLTEKGYENGGKGGGRGAAIRLGLALNQEWDARIKGQAGAMLTGSNQAISSTSDLSDPENAMNDKNPGLRGEL